LHGHCSREAWLSLAELEFDQVEVEKSNPDGLKPDVLLSNKGLPILGIEVVVTHAVDAAKAGKLNHPWIEVEARQVLRSPRSWKPVQMNHPWSGICKSCVWAQKINDYEFQENIEPGEYVAELSACFFESHLREWIQSSSGRIKPVVHWRCPWCRKSNHRDIHRNQIHSAGLSSSLLPPCEPEVTLRTVEGHTISILFGFPKIPSRPRIIFPMKNSPRFTLRATPDPKSPLRLTMNGTNRPLAFICKFCARDCLGTIPAPSIPLKEWEALSQTQSG
jgi:hypothetical protein